MDILVYGAGAIGGYLGARLGHSGHNVVLIGRPATAALVNAEGLSITDDGFTQHILLPAFNSPAEAFQSGFYPDLVIMSMKSYDLAAAIEPLACDCPDSTVIMSTQNGIDVERPLIERFGPERIVASVLTIPVSKRAANKLVVERSKRGMGLAPAQPGDEIGRWAKLMLRSGIRTQQVADYQALKWSKALLNIVGNASSAILNRPPAVLYRSPIVFQLEMQMLREALAVVKARRIRLVNLPGAPARRLAAVIQRAPDSLLQPLLVRMVNQGRGDKMPSFHIDLRAGKGQNEVVYHNGAIAKAGRAVDVLTPVNQAYNDILLKLVRGELDSAEFDGDLRRLATEVNKYL